MFHVLIDFTHARISIKLKVSLSTARLQCSEVEPWGRVNHLWKENKMIKSNESNIPVQYWTYVISYKNVLKFVHFRKTERVHITGKLKVRPVMAKD